MILTFSWASFQQMRSLLRPIMSTTLVFLSCLTCLPAQDAGKAKSASKTVNVVITDENNKPLEAAKIILATGCKCDPCKERKVDCWIYCCAPGRFTPETVATETTGAGGVFELKADQLTPGDYTITVESGRFTKDIQIQVDKDHRVKVKGPGVIRVDAMAFEVPITTVVQG